MGKREKGIKTGFAVLAGFLFFLFTEEGKKEIIQASDMELGGFHIEIEAGEPDPVKEEPVNEETEAPEAEEEVSEEKTELPAEEFQPPKTEEPEPGEEEQLQPETVFQETREIPQEEPKVKKTKEAVPSLSPRPETKNQSPSLKEEETVCFFHSLRPVLAMDRIPAIRVSAKESLYIYSYEVNGNPVSAKWDQDTILPEQPKLKEGKNKIELFLLTEKGEIIAMTPWEFIAVKDRV